MRLRLLILALCLLTPAWSWAGDSPDFARRLAAQGELRAAAVEYRRFLFENPEIRDRTQVNRELARVYLRLGRGDAALKLVENEDRPPPEAVSITARALLLLKRQVEAERYLTGLSEARQIPDEVRHQALLELGLIRLRRAEFKAAAELFGRIPTGSKLGLKAAFLAKEAPKGAELEELNPSLYAVLSGILPGLGQALMGRITDALWASSLSIGPGIGAYLALASGAWVTGIVVGLAALAFYGGNIYHALNTAHQENRDRVENFVKKLESQAEGL